MKSEACSLTHFGTKAKSSIYLYSLKLPSCFNGKLSSPLGIIKLLVHAESSINAMVSTQTKHLQAGNLSVITSL
jgi:hypothetical protein